MDFDVQTKFLTLEEFLGEPWPYLLLHQSPWNLLCWVNKFSVYFNLLIFLCIGSIFQHGPASTKPREQMGQKTPFLNTGQGSLNSDIGILCLQLMATWPDTRMLAPFYPP